MQALPGSLLMALVAPMALTRGRIEAVAAALVVLTMLRTGGLIAAIVIGVGAAALRRAFG